MERKPRATRRSTARLTPRYKIVGTDSVGAVAGAQLRNQAVTATLFGLVGILLFIAFRYDWTYAAGAVIAVFHDVLMVLAFFSVFQWEINLTVIAAILTIVGFSVNDSIVIFDRVRENLAVNRTDSLFKITNDSINQTLSRTIITAGLVLLSVLALVLFGGEVLEELFACTACRRYARNILDDRYRQPDRDLVAEQARRRKGEAGKRAAAGRKWRRRHVVRSPAGRSRGRSGGRSAAPKTFAQTDNELKIFREKFIKTSFKT